MLHIVSENQKDPEIKEKSLLLTLMKRESQDHVGRVDDCPRLLQLGFL